MLALRVTVLGGFEARLASGIPVRLPTKKARALLAYLACHAGQNCPRDKLAALLWGLRSEAQGRSGLRQAIAALRRGLAGTHPSLLRVEGQAVALDPAGAEVDVVAFERRLTEGTPASMDEAVELYRGDLLLGFVVNEPLFEEWLVAERERLREMALEVLARRLAHQGKAGTPDRAIQTALRLLALDPLQESVHRALMRLYVQRGRRGSALKQYQLCVGVLKRELGTEPEAETRQLYRDVLQRRIAAPTGAAERTGAQERGAASGEPALPDLPAVETPLFGRDAELARLRALLGELAGGRGHVVTLVGEAGIGKTRLINALAADALADGCQVLVGRCHESDSLLPFGPWVDACRSGRLGSDEEILGGLHPSLRAELTRLLPEAGTAGLPPASDSALLLFESVLALVEQVAARRPLVLALEDLHWADEMSLRLLAFVSRRVPSLAVLLISTARTEDLADAALAQRTVEDLAHSSPAMPIVLAPLSRSDAARLVRAHARVGSDASTVAELEKKVWAMSEGNPFVAVEGVRALERNPDVVALPSSVRHLVTRRLDRLSERGRKLAAVAAVIGRQFPFALLRAAGGVEEKDAAEAVEEMVRHSVLQAVGDQLDFTHDRVRDVAYGRLLLPRRRLLHRAVLAALEEALATIAERAREPGALGGESIEQLAHHALNGELPEKAARYLRQAGLRAMARSALPEARAWFERAIGALEALPESPPVLEQAFEIRLELRSVLMHLGEGHKVLECLRETETIAERLADDGRRGTVYSAMAVTHFLLGELDAALAAGSRAREIGRRLGDLRLRVHATSQLLQAHYWRGEHERVLELAADNLAAVPAELVHDRFGMMATPTVLDRSWLLLSLSELGRFPEAATHAAEAIRIAESTRHAYSIGFAHCSAGALHMLAGDWRVARDRLEQGIQVLRSGHALMWLSTPIANSAWALAELGESNVALKRVHEGEQIAEHLAARGFVGFLGWFRVSLARARLALGQLDEARRQAHRGLESTAHHAGCAAHMRLVLADITSHPDGLDAAGAEDHYRQALALAEPRGMRPLVAHCHWGLGRLHARGGQRERAADHLRTAVGLYADMAQPAWLARARRALDELA